MLWTIIVLLPKGGGNYREIGLLDPVWKVIEVIMHNRFKSLYYHDYLHGFLTGCGTWTAATKVKLVK